ncbi:hypothetical protein PY650_18360 [Rhizobium calliandrae]|uniref:Uncharacterized protein n=1 Tax=Rhizobium calliandrae TaxID=1312182 RepID=A0ABT7KGP7_9HYPH|nr:hypothetical protein [Rhizobium calliandrae]MDL2407591.1 hypothetical protein [Rhizobium calliandrae]
MLQTKLQSIKHILSLNEDIRSDIKAYLACAQTDCYKAAGQEMLTYLDIYLDRAGSIERLAKTNETVPVFGTFPKAFERALSEEIEARKNLKLESSPQSCLPG